MSWLARSIANSLRIDDDDDHRDHHVPVDTAATATESPASPSQRREEEDDASDAQKRGVKDDLSELGETLSRQIWGVASFLAPCSSQPSTPSRPHANRTVSDWDRWESSHPSVSGRVSGDVPDEGDNGAGISGVRSDIAEIGGRFRTGMSNLSHHRTVSEISRIASNFLPFVSEEKDLNSVDEYDFQGAVGVTEEVLTFAKNIAMHPETWLDFPLEEEQDMDDFDLSDAQGEHALAVQQLLPRLAALRIELCPGHMSEGYFWKVYFVLLHSRLNKHDSELLLTPQVVAARARWMQELKRRAKSEQDWSKRSTSCSTGCIEDEDVCCSAPGCASYGNMSARMYAFDPITEIQPIDKYVIDENPVTEDKEMSTLTGPPFMVNLQNYGDEADDEDDWLQETSELGSYNGITVDLGDEEIVSFSDLEDDDDVTMPVKLNPS